MASVRRRIIISSPTNIILYFLNPKSIKTIYNKSNYIHTNI